MSGEADLHQNIFRYFTSAKTREEQAKKISIEKHKLTKKLLYFYGMYVSAENGLCLYEAHQSTKTPNERKKSIFRKHAKTIHFI